MSRPWHSLTIIHDESKKTFEMALDGFQLEGVTGYEIVCAEDCGLIKLQISMVVDKLRLNKTNQ